MMDTFPLPIISIGHFESVTDGINPAAAEPATIAGTYRRLIHRYIWNVTLAD